MPRLESDGDITLTAVNVDQNDDSVVLPSTSAANNAYANANSSVTTEALLKKITELEARIFYYEAHTKFLCDENHLLRSQLTACATAAEDDNSSSPSNRVCRPRKQAKKNYDVEDVEVTDAAEHFPSLPKTRDPRRRATGTPTYNPSGNRFAVLAESATNHNQNAVPSQEIPMPRTTSASASSTVASSSRKKVIQAINIDLFNVRRHLANAKVSDFCVKQTSAKGPVKITITNESQVDAAKAALVKNRVSYHEYKWADEKRKCFVIRGLVGTQEEHLQEIKEDLINAGLPDSIEVSLHYTGYMRANPSAAFNPPVKMVVPPNFDDKILQGIRHLNHIAVRFELFKSHSVVQCKNCQRFGHSAGGCMHEHRCVKCGLNHLREDCPRTHSAHHKLRCCNCGGEHTANNLNSCPYFQENFAKKPNKPNASARSASAATTSSASVQPGVSFAHIVDSSGPTKRPTQKFSIISNNANNNQINSITADETTEISLDKLIDYFEFKFEQFSHSLTKHDRVIELLSAKLLND